jgi:hypothetical protein
MLGLIGAALWFGYNARKNGRTEVGWGLLGILCYIVFTVTAKVIAVSMTVRTESDATAMSVVINVFVYGALILIPLAITPKESPQPIDPVGLRTPESAPGLAKEPQDAKHEDVVDAPLQ